MNAVAFSALNALLFKPLGFPGVEALGWIMTRSPGNPYGLRRGPITRTSREPRARSSPSRQKAACRSACTTFTGDAHAPGLGSCRSGNYLSTLGATTEIGRIFNDADRSTSEIPAVVSSRFWSGQLGGGDSVAGRTLTLNGRIVSIVGVVRDGFQGPGGLYEPDVWVPLDRMQVLNVPARRLDRSEAWLTVVGRMSPGVSAAQAAVDLQSVAGALAADHPATNKQRSLAFAPMVDGNPEVRSLAPVGWIALAIVGVVLLIACFNVAALLLPRAADRQREIGVRTALGASRGRILRQFAMEGLMLALVSGVAAIVVAGWSADLLSAFSLPSPIPQRLHIGVDRRLVGFTVMLVALAGIVPSLLPARQATRITWSPRCAWRPCLVRVDRDCATRS